MVANPENARKGRKPALRCFHRDWTKGGAARPAPEGRASERDKAVDGDVPRQEAPGHARAIRHTGEIEGSAQMPDQPLRGENRRLHGELDSNPAAKWKGRPRPP